MAITLEQVGRTWNSVTFSVSGITNDRMTKIMPRGYSGAVAVSLAIAKERGYIADYSAAGGNNGTITVVFHSVDVETFKIWKIRVSNYVGGIETEQSETLLVGVGFDWDHTTSKSSGGEFDLTAHDLLQLNYYSSEICYWLGLFASYYEDGNIKPGVKFRAAFLTSPSENIYNAAGYLSASKLPNCDKVMRAAQKIISTATTGSPVYAYYFNDIRGAINNFNLRC